MMKSFHWLFLALAAAVEHHHHEKNRIPTFSTEDVLEGRVDTALAEIWQSTGILALSIKEEEEEGHSGAASSFSTTDALQGLCRCQSALQDYHHARQEQQQQHDQSPQVVQHAPLHDDATTWRTTLATATVGTTPLPLWLPKKEEESSPWPCSSDTFTALEELRDRVSGATQVFLHALDRYLAQHQRSFNHDHKDQQPYLMRHAYGGGYHTVAELQAAGNHLEHFHIYDKAASSSSHKATLTTLGDSGSTPFQEEIEDEQDHEVDSSRPPTLNWHTDAGLFLSFVPAVNCHGDENDDSSRRMVDDSFVLPNGQRAIFDNPNHVVVFMLGAGAQHWLQLPQQHNQNDMNKPLLQATRHAVHMPAGQVRAWYGMMTLVPDIAIVQEHPEPQTFGDMKRRLSQHAAATARRQETSSSLLSSTSRRRTSRTKDTNQHDDDHLFSWTPTTQRTLSIGCGAYTPVSELEEESDASMANGNGNDKDQLLFLGGRRLRADHVQSPDACNNSTNFFCWMSCMDIPDAGRIEERLNDGQSLYCMDPAIYDGTAHHKVKAATEPCAQGHVHNANCLGQWAPTAHGVTPYDFPQYDHHHSTNDDPDPHNHDPDDTNSTNVDFCYGGTSMYMDGFHWTDTTCVIYLFPEWVLSTQGKLAAAGIGTVMFGAGLEWVIYWRRWTMTSLSSSSTSRPLRMVTSGLFYGLQLSMGYMLMLVIMTYSGVLFFCTIMGLVMGHVLFNSKDAVFAHKKKPHEQENDMTPSEGEGTKNGRPAHGTGLAATMSTTRSAGSSRFLHLHAFQSQRMNAATDDEEVGTATLDTTNPSTTCPCNGDSSSGGGSSHNDTAANNDLIVDDSSLLAATTTTTKPSRTPTAETDWNIPEGATPCCQNEL